MNNNMFSNRKDNVPNLLAGLNFNLPVVAKSQHGRHEFDVAIIYRVPRGTKNRSATSIDCSPLFRQLNTALVEGTSQECEWKPKHASLGNDTRNRLFLIFDQKIVQSVPTNYDLKTRRMMINSKAIVQKAFLVLKKDHPAVQIPTVQGSGLVIHFNSRKMNDDDMLYELVPIRIIQEYADEKMQPKVININNG